MDMDLCVTKLETMSPNTTFNNDFIYGGYTQLGYEPIFPRPSGRNDHALYTCIIVYVYNLLLFTAILIKKIVPFKAVTTFNYNFKPEIN